MLLDQAITPRQPFRITRTDTVSLTETNLNWSYGRRHAMLPERSTKANFYTYRVSSMMMGFAPVSELRMQTLAPSNCPWGAFCFVFDKLLCCTNGIVLLFFFYSSG